MANLCGDCALKLQANEETYSMLLESIGTEPVDVYLTNMAKDRTWGDGTVLLAAANLYKRQIILYTDESKRPIYMSDKFSDSHALTLGFVGGNHYVSLLPTSSLLTAFDTQSPHTDIPVSTTTEHVEASSHFVPISSKYGGRSAPPSSGCDKKVFMKRKLKYPWLLATGDGALCISCSAYYSSRPLPKGTKGVFINIPFTKWTKSTGSDPKNNKLLKHDLSGIHKTAIACDDEGKRISRHHTSVYGMVHKQSLEQQRINLERMSDFVDVAYYLFKQEIPHTTNYDSLLNLVARLDNSHGIEQFMMSSPENATYQSHNTATELLSASAKWLQEKLLSAVRSSPAIALMADESTDIRVRNEMSICCRYIEDGKAVERFICLQRLKDTTANTISTAVQDWLASAKIPLLNIRWLAFDGAANMSGKHHGVQAQLKKNLPNSNYIHCRSHLLHLAAANVASSFKPLKVLFSSLNSLWKFFHNSPKRTNQLNEIQSILDDPVLQLVRNGDTRWTSNYRSVKAVRTCLRSIIFTLQDIHTGGADLSSEAGGLLLTFQNSTSILLIFALELILQPLHTLTLSLQSSKLSLADVPSRVSG